MKNQGFDAKSFLKVKVLTPQEGNTIKGGAAVRKKKQRQKGDDNETKNGFM